MSDRFICLKCGQGIRARDRMGAKSSDCPQFFCSFVELSPSEAARPDGTC